MKKCLLVAGGAVSAPLLKKIFREGDFAYVFAVDRGLEALDACGIRPTHLVGDFDSVAPVVLAKYLPRETALSAAVFPASESQMPEMDGGGQTQRAAEDFPALSSPVSKKDGGGQTQRAAEDFPALSSPVLKKDDAGQTQHSAANFPVLERLIPEKDDTDTEHAMRQAVALGPDEIVLVGGFGTRFDHVLANVHTLTIPLRAGVPACMADETNRVRLLEGPGGCGENGKTICGLEGETHAAARGRVAAELRIKKRDAWGKYVSLLPLTSKVTGITLKGFKYPLNDKAFKIGETVSLGVSNELTAEEGMIRVKSGILAVIESADEGVIR